MDRERLKQAREQLRARFGGSLEDDLLEQCAEICKNNNLSADDLFYKWEAIMYNITPRVFDQDSIHAIKEQLERDAVKLKAQRGQPKSNLNGLLTRNLGNIGKSTGRVDASLSRTNTKPLVVNVKSESRKPGLTKVRVTLGGDPASTTYRYMYEKISDRSEGELTRLEQEIFTHLAYLALDDRIDEFADIVQKYYDITDLGDPGASTEEEVTIIGRITFDADSSSGPIKLNEATLTLESSRSMGSGARVPLRFDPNVKVRAAKRGRGGVGFFPGAIVALRGKNGGGGWFLVSEVLTLPPTNADSFDANSEPFSTCIACGPFTSDADLNYEPWKAALMKMSLEMPDVILLVGPFIDSTHICVKNGDIDDSPEALFRKVFLDPLSNLLDQIPGALAILVPNVRDILSDHAVFPQRALARTLVDDLRIHLFPNPCHFMLNKTSFAVSSVDVLFHLRKEEIFRRMSEIQSTFPQDDEAPTSDVMANLCRHVLEQRSFYPIFPVPHDLLHEVNLDVSHFKALKVGGEAIDNKSLSVLVLPSKLKHFTKKIGDTTVLNPSYTSKGIMAMVNSSSNTLEQKISGPPEIRIIHIV